MQTIHANELLAGLTLAEPLPVTAVVTDSRKVQPGCVFVCFAGERVDGHDFAAAAYQNAPPPTKTARRISLPTIPCRAYPKTAPSLCRTAPLPWCVWRPTTGCCSARV